MNKEKHYIDTLYYQIEQTAKYCRSLGAQLFEKLNMGINVEEFVTLDILSIHGEMCQRDLARIILKDRPSTGRILNLLEEKGLVSRCAGTKNNRLIRKIVMTDEGKSIQKKTLDALKVYLETIPRMLSEEKMEEMKKNMREFRESLEKEVEMNI